MPKKTFGRPPVITKEILQKLEAGFSIGYTDEEACLYANIAPSTLYNYCKKNPDFLERKEQLKGTVSLHAKRNLAMAIKKGDLRHSTWWLERKNRNEFSTDTKIPMPNKPEEPTIDAEGMAALDHLFALREKEKEERAGYYEWLEKQKNI